MTLAVNFPLDALSDDSLRLLITALTGDRLNWRFGCALYDALTNEQIRRLRLAAGQNAEHSELVLPLLSIDEMRAALVGLRADFDLIEQTSKRATAAECAEFYNLAEFINAVTRCVLSQLNVMHAAHCSGWNN
jgi:hypothetical protein